MSTVRSEAAAKAARLHAVRRVGRWIAVAPVALHAALALSQAAPQPPADFVHAVSPGETLYGLAERYTGKSADWVQLQRRNDIANPHRLVPGSELRIPFALLASMPAVASVVYVTGDVHLLQSDGTPGAPLQDGAQLPQGARIEVGIDGYARLQMPDGAVVRIPANSRARLIGVRPTGADQAPDTLIQLESGRVDASAKPRRGKASRFEIHTPLAVASVRGTEFGVAVQPDAAVTGEVTQGVVALQGRARDRKHESAQARELHAGQGARVSSTGVMGQVRALPEAPDLNAVPATVTDADFVQLSLPAEQRAAAWRVRIAKDPAMEQVVRNGLFDSPEIRFAGLDDGDYVIGARAVDGEGLSGVESTRALRVKARPVAPLFQRPGPAEQIAGHAVELACAQPAGIQRFRFQVASDEAFQSLQLDDLSATECIRSATLPFGRYYWRVASIRTTAEGVLDQGPFSGSRSFELVTPPPAAPTPSIAADDGLLQISWTGVPGYRYVVQVSRDAHFAHVAQQVHDEIVTEASLRLPNQPPGRYYVRIKAVAPQGLAGEFSEPQAVVIEAVVHASDGGALRDAQGKAVSRE
jgi:hypothetical protein